MIDFVFDENKVKKALKIYCDKVNELYKAGNIESSYDSEYKYPNVERMISSIGKIT